MGDTFDHAARRRSVVERLIGMTREARGWSRRHRLPLLAAALALFVGGLVYSITTLKLEWQDLHLTSLLMLVFALGPVTIVYSAINMQVMARAIGVHVDFWHGVRVSAFAQVAELLPIPGGAIVRTAALMERGGTTGKSAGIVAAFALLWIGCAALGGGIALRSNGAFGPLLTLAGIVAISAITFWLAGNAGWKIALIAFALRLIGLCLVATRIAVAFLVIGLLIDSADAFAFAFAIVLGSAASIVPAGLGIGEGLSALMAGPTGISTAAAFTAAAINRLAGFAVNMSVAGLATIFHREPIAPIGEHNA